MSPPYITTASDPRRWTRRHHYQEGPDFLFLATQNGRPAGEPQRPSLAEVRRRMRAIRLVAESGVGLGQEGDQSLRSDDDGQLHRLDHRGRDPDRQLGVDQIGDPTRVRCV